jgi:protoporphyrinogen oxidase
VNALLPKRAPKDRSDVVKTLIDSFRYPRRGPGMLWEACTDKIRALGGKVELGARVVGAVHDQARNVWTVRHEAPDGTVRETLADHVVSSAPLRELAPSLAPALSEAALSAARALRYRDFLTVVLILKDRNVFNDNWIYIHDESVKVGRVQHFKSWSPEMVPDPSMVCYGLEYFCFEGDGLWTSTDDELIALGKRELAAIGLAAENDVVDGCVVRMKKAYPVYDDDYAANVDVIRAELEARFPTLHPVGRNGMHKYNNQDHAMMTAMLTVKNILAGRRVFDVWSVNQDAEYHEDAERGATGLRAVPRRVAEGP